MRSKEDQRREQKEAEKKKVFFLKYTVDFLP